MSSEIQQSQNDALDYKGTLLKSGTQKQKYYPSRSEKLTAERFKSFEMWHFDSYIEERTGYDPELMRLYGAQLHKGVAVPVGTLGNNANKVDRKETDYTNLPVTPSLKDQERHNFTEKTTRKKLYSTRHQIQQLQIQPERCQKCATESIGKESGVFLDIENGSCRMDSLETCSSVWACPVCRHKILNQRQQDLNKLGELYEKDGGKIYLLTLTIPHYQNERLATVKDGLMSTFKRLIQSKMWRKFKKNFDGYTRCIEINYGENGFHPHIHMLIYTPENIDCQKRSDQIYKKWFDLVSKYQKRTPKRAYAVDLRPAEKKDYLAKWAGANELTGLSEKSGKNGNYTITDLENLLVSPSKNSPDCLPVEKVASILYEYYTETKGNRLLTHSQTIYKDGKSLKKYYLQDEKTDEEITQIDKEEYQKMIPVASVTDDGIRLLSSSNHLSDLKDIFETVPINLAIETFCFQYPQYSDFIKPKDDNFTTLPTGYFDGKTTKKVIFNGCTDLPPEYFTSKLSKDHPKYCPF